MPRKPMTMAEIMMRNAVTRTPPRMLNLQHVIHELVILRAEVARVSNIVADYARQEAKNAGDLPKTSKKL